MIRVGKDFVIKSYDNGYSVYDVMVRGDDVKKGEPGTEYYREIGSTTTLRDALEIIVKKSQRRLIRDGDYTLDEAIHAMLEQEKRIKALIEGKVEGL
jgi:hypothetical protein